MGQLKAFLAKDGLMWIKRWIRLLRKTWRGVR